ncbi:MAG: radical SAM protein [Firmicutes bacterium]|nr:radical SAM protein [Candidatus Colimorpha enterica]
MDKCFLCPRRCGVSRKENNYGFCRSGLDVRVARIAPHYWEEPCICGENGSGTVFFVGCNLRCSYCQNGLISGGGDIGKVFSASELADEYMKLQDMGVSNVNFVTPTHYSYIIPESLDIAWEKGLYLPAVYNCGGYESVETLKALSGYISVYLPDFKYLSPEMSKRYSSAPDYPDVAKKALAEMVRQRENVYTADGMLKKGVIVRHLVLPGYTEESKKVLDYLHGEYGDDIIISIMGQYTPFEGCPDELSRKLSDAEYDDIVDYALKIGISNAYIQSTESASESFVPKWDFIE